MSVREDARKMHETAPLMAAAPAEVRNAALSLIAERIEENKEAVFAANAEDVAAAKESGISQAVMKRLIFNEGKLQSCKEGIAQLIGLEDPVGKRQIFRELDEGLVLTRVSCPIGVIGVIFEARPDALVQISTLCIKSGNCAILKGGKETERTNRALFEIISRAALEAGLPEGCLMKAESHDEIDELLKCDRYVDLLIPRGSNAFVRHIMENTKIPVMGHADGICHVYVDSAADFDKAVRIVVDAKTQYTAACNAAETLLIARDIAAEFLPKAAAALDAAGVKLRGTAEAEGLLGASEEKAPAMEIMGEDGFATEYLDKIISVKLVEGVKEAVGHINRFGSHHTDAIVTEDEEAASYFTQMVDSAGVYVNASTRFADGFRYGFGAEVGISTGKIHARGPVGLEGLVTYKYILKGNGDTVAPYSDGTKHFHFRDL